MAISSETNVLTFAGSGTTGPFAITYEVLAAADLVVYERDDTTGEKTALSYVASSPGSGQWTIDSDLDSVTTGDAVASGTTLYVEREPSYTQPTDFTPGGKLKEETLENAIDRVVMLTQANRKLLDRLTGADRLSAYIDSAATTSLLAFLYSTVEAASSGFVAGLQSNFTIGDSTKVQATYGGAGGTFLVQASGIIAVDGSSQLVALRLSKSGTAIDGSDVSFTSETGLYRSFSIHTAVELDTTDTIELEVMTLTGDDVQVTSATLLITPLVQGGGTVPSTSDTTQAFGELYVDEGSTATTVATGATYVKLVQFTDAGQSLNCTADSINDKITITTPGRYRVSCSVSFTSSTNNTIVYMAAFLDGVEQDNLHLLRKVGTGGDNGNAGFTGFIDVTTAPVDLDLRARHDQPGNVDVTLYYGNLNVEYVGTT